MQRKKGLESNKWRRMGRLLAIGLILTLPAGCATQQASAHGNGHHQKQIHVVSHQTTVAQSCSTQQSCSHKEALQLCCDLAGVKAQTVKDFSVELDKKEGCLVYDVEFIYKDNVYEYCLDAATKKVLSQKQEKYLPDPVEKQVKLTHQQALEAALKEGAFAAKNVQVCKNHLQEEDQRPVYEIAFLADGKVYQYEIDGIKGTILEQKQQQKPATTGTEKKPSGQDKTSQTTVLTIEKAKAIALRHAGVAEKDAQDWSIETEREQGSLIYEIEFEVGRTEYEYEIDGNTGKILKAEID